MSGATSGATNRQGRSMDASGSAGLHPSLRVRLPMIMFGTLSWPVTIRGTPSGDEAGPRGSVPRP